jgi:MFS family permease
MTRATPRRPVAILGLLTIVAYGSWFYGFGVLLDDLRVDLDTTLGALTGGYALAQILTGLFGMVSGRLVDRHGATLPLAVGGVVGPGLLVLASYATAPVVFVVAFGFGGGVIGATGFYHLTQTIVARLAPGGEARSIARLTVWGAFSSPLLIPLTEFARATFGWRWTMRSGALAVAALSMFAAMVVDPGGRTRSERPSTTPLGAVRAAWTDRSVRRLAGSALAGSFGMSVLVVLQVPTMVAAGLERSTAATLAGARGIAQLLGRLPLGWVLRRMPAKTALRRAKVVVALGTLLLAASGQVVFAIAFVVLAGVGLGAVSPLEGIYAREVLPPHDLGTLMGSLHLTLGLASGLGPLAAAALNDLTATTWVGVLVAAAASLLGAALLSSPRNSSLTDSRRGR